VLAALDIILVAELATLVSTVKAPWLNRRLTEVLIAVVVLARLVLESWPSGFAEIWDTLLKSNSKSITPPSITALTADTSSLPTAAVVAETRSSSGTFFGI
jgi:hypothetical protein